MFIATPHIAHPRNRSLPWLLIGGYTVATLDMTFAIAWWVPHGISASRILQSVASWILGPAAFTGGTATALLGALLYAHVMWGVVALYHAIARRRPVLLRQPVRCGATYGVLAYLFLFQLVAPLLTGRPPDLLHNIAWTLACIAVFMILVGVPCALFSRAAANDR